MILKLWNSPGRNQYLAVIAVNVISFVYGHITGWLSPALLVLYSDETPLNGGPLSTAQVSWLISQLFFGGALGALLSEFIVIHFGNRGTFIHMAFPELLWLGVVGFGNEYWQLMVARFIVGYTGGNIFKTMPFFVGDIAQSNIRGSLGAIMPLFYNTGILSGYALGMFVPYRYAAYMFVIPVLYIFLILACIPDTPQYLLSKGDEEGALKALCFYRTVQSRENIPESVRNEFADLKASLKLQHKGGAPLSDLLLSKHRSALVLTFFVYLLPFATGFYGFVQISATVFVESGSNMDPNYASLIVAVLIITGNFSSTLLADRMKRKNQLYISCTGAGILLTLFATYAYLAKNDFDVAHLNWIPVVSFSAAIFLMGLGISSIVYAVATELLRPEIRGLGMSTMCCAAEIVGSLVITAIPYMLDAIRIYGTIWTFAGVCFTGLMIVVVFLPETKGKNLLLQH